MYHMRHLKPGFEGNIFSELFQVQIKTITNFGHFVEQPQFSSTRKILSSSEKNRDRDFEKMQMIAFKAEGQYFYFPWMRTTTPCIIWVHSLEQVESDAAEHNL